MIKVDGTLRVKKIQSRNGPFSVGTLITGIGNFKVKDQVLEPFDEGNFQVTAWIVHIYPGTYVTEAGWVLTEIRAKLQDLQVRGEEQADIDRTENNTAGEPDPLDETPPVTVKPVPQTRNKELGALKSKLMAIGRGRNPDPKSNEPATLDTPEQAQATQDKLRALFTEDLCALIESRQPIKLDTSIDRLRLRTQAFYLKNELDYWFDKGDQTFHPV
ncbi:MAG: DUF3275 family protein [Azonexus sp.]|nr:DUF3275 family protein [Azonexus sp.]